MSMKTALFVVIRFAPGLLLALPPDAPAIAAKLSEQATISQYKSQRTWPAPAFALIITLLLTVFSPNACNAAPPTVTDPVSAHLSPSDNLKAYALMVCFGDGFPDDKTLEHETTRAARFYIDNGEYPIEAYNETAALAAAFLKKNYLSENGEKWTAMKCIDLQHSNELRKLIKKYAPTRTANTKNHKKPAPP